TVFDFDGDGVDEIAVTHQGALVIGSAREGRWAERLRLEECRLWNSPTPVAPDRPGEAYRIRQRPIALGTGTNRSWICTRAGEKRGGEKLILLSVKPGADFSVTEQPVSGLQELQLLAATPDRLIAATRDGKLGTMSAAGRFEAQWACG